VDSPPSFEAPLSSWVATLIGSTPSLTALPSAVPGAEMMMGAGCTEMEATGCTEPNGFAGVKIHGAIDKKKQK
jgi:hypothetical protein